MTFLVRFPDEEAQYKIRKNWKIQIYLPSLCWIVSLHSQWTANNELHSFMWTMDLSHCYVQLHFMYTTRCTCTWRNVHVHGEIRRSKSVSLLMLSLLEWWSLLYKSQHLIAIQLFPIILYVMICNIIYDDIWWFVTLIKQIIERNNCSLNNFS